MPENLSTLNFGLSLVGFSLHRIENTRLATNLERFVASYGVHPDTCSKNFDDIREMCLDEGDRPLKRMDVFLIYLCWLKNYNTDRCLAGIFNKDEKTVRRWIVKYGAYFGALKEKKVCIYFQ